MKVSGFTIVRNAIKYDYPVVEAISSILPLCDELIVAVGNSEDETRNLISSIRSEKIKIIDTIWDDSLREGGKVLAAETQKAFNAISKDADWGIYIQADEVMHEKYHDNIRKAMQQWKDDERVEGLVFDYTHFYGSYDYTGDSRKWYRREVRVIKNDKNIYSFRDAQGFQKNGKPLKVKMANAQIFHYGWVKHPKFQQAKQESFNKLWHDDEWMKKNIRAVDEFDYSQIDSLKHFKGDHPLVMQERIKKQNWKFSFDPTKKKNTSLRHRFLQFIENLTGWRVGGYRNYKIV